MQRKEGPQLQAVCHCNCYCLPSLFAACVSPLIRHAVAAAEGAQLLTPKLWLSAVGKGPQLQLVCHCLELLGTPLGTSQSSNAAASQEGNNSRDSLSGSLAQLLLQPGWLMQGQLCETYIMQSEFGTVSTGVIYLSGWTTVVVAVSTLCALLFGSSQCTQEARHNGGIRCIIFL